MIRVQFNNQKSVQMAEFEQVSNDVVRLTGEKIRADTSGFKVYRLNGDFLGDYSEYVKIVEASDSYVKLSR